VRRIRPGCNFFRESNEAVIKIKNDGDGKIPQGLLQEGTKGKLTSLDTVINILAIGAFISAKNKDLMNERRPE
jgi:hypothetical protein